MTTREFTFNGKTYRVDSYGFLVDPAEWDEDFVRGMAPEIKLSGGLTDDHWRVINFIRNSFDKMNACPLVYVACKKNQLGLGDLKRLFPSGYLRGACKLAGVTYRECHFQRYWLEENLRLHEHDYDNKEYRTDVRGFLLNPEDWDEYFALNKAYELKMPDYLTKKHWDIIHFLREHFRETGEVPTVYETCAANGIDLEELERLFPDGYHRGAVKIAGLRAH
jgi:tRNA 2-thiouridine synthesizing protein E